MRDSISSRMREHKTEDERGRGTAFFEGFLAGCF
jgi:hypothetical protein